MAGADHVTGQKVSWQIKRYFIMYLVRVKLYLNS